MSTARHFQWWDTHARLPQMTNTRKIDLDELKSVLLEIGIKMSLIPLETGNGYCQTFCMVGYPCQTHITAMPKLT